MKASGTPARDRSNECRIARLGVAPIPVGAWPSIIVVTASLVLLGSCGSPAYSRHGANHNDGGPGGSGGGIGSTGGSGGIFGTGGTAAASGGSGPIATGGAIGTGGGTSTGGAASTGGSTASGGSIGTGGSTPTGGAIGTGGSTPTGGAASTGGPTASGGSVGTGGRVATGGSLGTGGSASGGATSTGGISGAAGAPTTDGAQYNFESTIQSWGMATGDGSFTSITRDTSRHFAGLASLAGAITATNAATYQLLVLPPAIPAGATVTFHLFVPTDAAIDWVQPYLQENGTSTPTFRWTGNYTLATGISLGTWTTLMVVVPTPVAPLVSLGVQFHTSAAWTGTVYIDSINW
jgi:hypothetical protein